MAQPDWYPIVTVRALATLAVDALQGGWLDSQVFVTFRGLLLPATDLAVSLVHSQPDVPGPLVHLHAVGLDNGRYNAN